MKKLFLALVLGAYSLSVQAALIDSGDGFIYDDVLDITWTQDANINGIDDWFNQVAWADGYSQTHSVYGTFDDWRLASMDVNGDGTIVVCSAVGEAACQDNEYGYLFHQYGISATSSSPFTNVEAADYWSGTEIPEGPSAPRAWAFHFHEADGGQGIQSWSNDNYAWAVRDGDVAVVPIPPAFWLFGSALSLLGWLRIRRTKE